MISNEELAEYVAQSSTGTTEEDKQKGKDWMLPPPPKKGEVIHCRICGKAMLPKDFSKNEFERKKEFKWQIHWACLENMFDQCDRATPGLIDERNGMGLRVAPQVFSAYGIGEATEE
jgi:hypothetical protein